VTFFLTLKHQRHIRHTVSFMYVRMDSSLYPFHCAMCTINCVNLQTVESSIHLLYAYVTVFLIFCSVVCVGTGTSQMLPGSGTKSENKLWVFIDIPGSTSYNRHPDSTRVYILLVKKVEVKWSRYRTGVAQRVDRGIALLFHDRGTRRGWVISSTPRPHFIPGKDPVPILQEAGWAPGPVWTGEKYIILVFNNLILICVLPGRMFMVKLCAKWSSHASVMTVRPYRNASAK